jgi:hypothetical protein
MKITIDTKSDSPDEIKMAMQLLSAVSKKKGVSVSQNLFEESPSVEPSASEPGIFNMFGNSSESSAPQFPSLPKEELEDEPVKRVKPEIMTY